MSLDYIDQYRQFHEQKTSFNGTSCLRIWREIVGTSRRLCCRSALDFGCAKGYQYERKIYEDGRPATLEQLLGYSVFKFDPAIPRFARQPTGSFDLVWCVDVLNCMPEANVRPTVRALYALADRALIVGVNSIECQKQLPDGTMAVQTFKPDAWWRALFDRPSKVEVQLVLD